MTSLAYGIDWIAAEKSGERELQRLPKRQRHELCQVHSWLSGSVGLKQYLEDKKILQTNLKKEFMKYLRQYAHSQWSIGVFR